MNTSTSSTDAALDAEQVIGLEQIEMEAWLDCYAAAPAAFAEEMGLSAIRMNNFALFALRQSSMSLFNRSLGLGLGERIDEATLERAVGWLRAHCGPTWAVPLAPTAVPDELSDWLSAKGLTASQSGIAKFERAGSKAAEAVECRYDVRLVDVEQGMDFGIATRQGFEMDEGYETWFAALAGRPHWRTYVAYHEAVPVGVGAMFVKDGSAWLGFGTTLAAYRGRGVQNAVLARRISDANALGLKTLAIETFHAGAGEAPNVSHRNVMRAGFAFAYLRQQYALA